MSPAQKHACFNLIIVALALATVLALYPSLGARARGGFGVLGIMGFGGLFFRRRDGRVVTDERDGLIRERSLTLAFRVFWVVFVLSGVFALYYYKAAGAVPLLVVEVALYLGWCLFAAAQSVATLAFYGRGS
jgi:hypothetical protein